MMLFNLVLIYKDRYVFCEMLEALDLHGIGKGQLILKVLNLLYIIC